MKAKLFLFFTIPWLILFSYLLMEQNRIILFQIQMQEESIEQFMTIYEITDRHIFNYAEPVFHGSGWDYRLYQDIEFKSAIEYFKKMDLVFSVDTVNQELNLFWEFGNNIISMDSIDIEELRGYELQYCLKSLYSKQIVRIKTSEFISNTCDGNENMSKTWTIDYKDSSSHVISKSFRDALFEDSRIDRIKNRTFWERAWGKKDSVYIPVFIHIQFTDSVPVLRVLCSDGAKKYDVEEYLRQYYSKLRSPDSNVVSFYFGMYINQGILNETMFMLSQKEKLH